MDIRETLEYDESWAVYVPADVAEQENVDALDAYLDDMAYR